MCVVLRYFNMTKHLQTFIVKTTPKGANKLTSLPFVRLAMKHITKVNSPANKTISHDVDKILYGK
jgi:predicted transglutaminase-like cysteine proteinase